MIFLHYFFLHYLFLHFLVIFLMHFFYFFNDSILGLRLTGMFWAESAIPSEPCALVVFNLALYITYCYCYCYCYCPYLLKSIDITRWHPIHNQQSRNNWQMFKLYSLLIIVSVISDRQPIANFPLWADDWSKAPGGSPAMREGVG